MQESKRVLFCANPDLNYIDGSSIWAQTFALALGATGLAKVDFLAKSPPAREELFGTLRAAPAIRILDGTDARHWRGKAPRRLDGKQTVELAVRLDQHAPYDLVVVRGLEIARELIEHPGLLSKAWVYLTDIPQALAEFSPELRRDLASIARGCRLLLCQSDGFVALWEQLVPGLDKAKVRRYSPVIPDLPRTLLPLDDRPERAIYAGKFKAEWKTLDMAREWSAVRDRVPSAELVMIGDKIHDEPNAPGFKAQMRTALEGTERLRWLGALSREGVQEELQKARVGLSWRDPSMDDTIEYSTKILEYGGAGCAAILNRNPLHERLLGQDYPLFANTAAEFREALVLALGDLAVLRRAADRLRQVAQAHTFSSRVAEISDWLHVGQTAKTAVVRKDSPVTNILIAGHDLKFFRPIQAALEATGRYRFTVDQWDGHARHDEAASRRLLKQADVIFCEWCLGNLEWYSRNKLPHQRLVARFHLQERSLPYFARSDWEAIDHVVYVSEPLREQARCSAAFPLDRTSVIPNLIDQHRFQARKKMGDARYTLGMIGMVPARKRLDRAVDLLEALLKIDPAYRLRVKGASPSSYPWLGERDDETVYYKSLFSRINSSELLRNKVIFDPPGDDVDRWLTLVGYILSPSDFESFHVAVGEGMSTGCVPVVWNWEGAERIWPAKYIVSSVEQAVSLVRREQPAESLRDFIIGNYSVERIRERWLAIFG